MKFFEKNSLCGTFFEFFLFFILASQNLLVYILIAFAKLQIIAKRNVLK